MRKPIRLVVMLITLAGLGDLSALQAQDAAKSLPRWRQRGWDKAKERIGLTDAQITQIKAVLRPEKDTLIDLSRKQHDARIMLRDVITKDGANEPEIRAAAATLGAAEGDLAVLRARLHARIRPLLTKEQFDKIAEQQDKLDDFVDGAIVGLIDRMVE